jgi:hypothetical protein
VRKKASNRRCGIDALGKSLFIRALELCVAQARQGLLAVKF